LKQNDSNVSTPIAPANQREIAEALKDASGAGLTVIPCGGGTKRGWGNPPSRADAILSTQCINRVVEHAWSDLTATVEAGCTVAALQQTLAEHGQRLAVDVLWPERATIGGILSTNDSGALRLRYGGLRDLIIGVTLALADGTLAVSGGKVVKNVAGYDLPKLVTGSMGTLGVITQAIFRLHPLPQKTLTLTMRARDLATMQWLILAIQDSKLAHAALQLRQEPESEPECDLLLEGTPAGLEAQRATLLKLAQNVVVDEGSDDVWSARQTLWAKPGAIAKFSVLPGAIATMIAAIQQASRDWAAVAQATGIGFVRTDANLINLRAEIERSGGSFVVLRQQPGVEPVEAWGNPGDALPLMRAVKEQFDPQGTLNPGVFVGGI
jgi:glycolate oxidase FAD binding subunit